MNCPSLSIICVTFNAINDLPNFFNSAKALKQIVKGFELIFIDGGSNDGTIECIQSNDLIVDKFISEPDSGIYNAMNKGLGIATGDFCIFLGADDTINVESFQQMLSILYVGQTVFYGRVEKSKNILGNKTNRWRILRENIPHQAIFYPRVVYTKERYNEKYKICADHEYNIRLIWNGTPYVYSPLVIANFGDQGISTRSTDYEFIKDYYKIIENHCGKFLRIFIYYSKFAKGIYRKWTC